MTNYAAILYSNYSRLSSRLRRGSTEAVKFNTLMLTKNVPFLLALKIQIIWMRIRELMMRIQIIFFSNVTCFVFALSLVT